jgi:hypothetical protein
MTRPHHYEHCDVPEGMTLAEYRARRHPAKPRKGIVARLRRRRTVVVPVQHEARRQAA